VGIGSTGAGRSLGLSTTFREIRSARRCDRDIQRARRVASQIRSGRVVINNMMDDPQAPWGGFFKFSGVGREYGQHGIGAFMETRAVVE